MLSDPEVKDNFIKYCVKGEKISSRLAKKIENYVEEKEKALEKKRQKKLKVTSEGKKDFNKVKPRDTKIKPTIVRSETSQLQMKKKIEKDLKDLEKVFSDVYSYNPGEHSDLGKNKNQNIKLRLRESKSY